MKDKQITAFDFTLKGLNFADNAVARRLRISKEFRVFLTEAKFSD